VKGIGAEDGMAGDGGGNGIDRRNALRWLGAGALAALAAPGRTAEPARPDRGATAPVLRCVARPAQTEGPFFVDERLERSDIRVDPASGDRVPGTLLRLTFAVGNLAGSACTPVRDAIVDVWQCDAAGRYSDVRDARGSTVGRKYLRGYQPTDDAGLAHFVTIVPGWYEGRAVHIHFRVDAGLGTGRARTFASQLYFDDAFIDRVHARPPYAARGAHRLRNAADGLYRRGGDSLLLDPAPAQDGYAARFDLALQA
jgi:protocatechuate 3,4-dioxygenase beta subunit